MAFGKINDFNLNGIFGMDRGRAEKVGLCPRLESSVIVLILVKGCEHDEFGIGRPDYARVANSMSQRCACGSPLKRWGPIGEPRKSRLPRPTFRRSATGFSPNQPTASPPMLDTGITELKSRTFIRSGHA
jgi:hypothetical protein